MVHQCTKQCMANCYHVLMLLSLAGVCAAEGFLAARLELNVTKESLFTLDAQTCSVSQGKFDTGEWGWSRICGGSPDDCCSLCAKQGKKCTRWTWDHRLDKCTVYDDSKGQGKLDPTDNRYSSGYASGAWPTFQSSVSLAADPWGAYYKEVYGEIPGKGYPLSPSSFWFLYSTVLIKKRVIQIPREVGLCPTANAPEGQRYAVNNMYSPPAISWVWHPYAYKAFSNNSWQEVIHEADPFGDEHFGAWFIYAPGSGIYFQIGKTIAFAEHADAYKHFAASSNEAMSRAAAAQNYDSVQFIAHVDHVNYQCDTKNTGRAGLAYMGVEIVGVKLVGLLGCTAPGGSPPSIRAGWQASKKCVCNNKKQFLNCDGVPSFYNPLVV